MKPTDTFRVAVSFVLLESRYLSWLLEEAQLALDFILLHAGGPDLINPLSWRTVSTHRMSIAVSPIEEDESSSVKISVKCLR